MSFMDKVKAKAEEWQVQAKAEKLAAEVEKAAHEAKEKAAAYADANRDRIREGLDRAGAKVDERTEGRYADKIAKAKQQLNRGVDKLAEQRGDGGPGTAQGPSAGSGYASGGYASGGYASDAGTPEPYRPDPIQPAGPLDEPRPGTGTGTGWPQDAPPKP